MPENDARLNDPSAGTPLEPQTPAVPAPNPAQKPVHQGLSLSLPTRNGEGFTVANDLRNNDPERKTILLTRRTSEGVLEEREIPRTTYERIVSGLEAKALKKGEKFPPKEKTPLLTRDEILTLDGKELTVRDYDAKRRGYYVRVLTPTGTFEEAFVERADLDRIHQDHKGKQLLTSEDRDQLRKRIFQEKRSAEGEKSEKPVTATTRSAKKASTPIVSPPSESTPETSATTPNPEQAPPSSPLAAPIQSQITPEDHPTNTGQRSTRSAWVKNEGSEELKDAAIPPTSAPAQDHRPNQDAPAELAQANVNARETSAPSSSAITTNVPPSEKSVSTSPTANTSTAPIGPIVQAIPASIASSILSTTIPPADIAPTPEPSIRETREILRTQQAAANELQEAKRFFTEQLQLVRPGNTQAPSRDTETRWEEALRATQSQFPEIDSEQLRALLQEPTADAASFRAAVPDIQRSTPSVSPVPTVRGLKQATSAPTSSTSTSLGERAGQAQINLRLRIDQANNALSDVRAKRQQNQQTAQTLSASLVQLAPTDPERTEVEATLDGLREENIALSQEEAMARALSLELAAQASELTALTANAEAANFRQPELNRALEERLASLPLAPPEIKTAARAASAPVASPPARSVLQAPKQGALGRLRNRVARPLLLMSALNAGQAMDRLPGATDVSSISGARVEALRTGGRSSRRDKVGRYDPETGQLLAAHFDDEREPLSFAERTEAMMDTRNQFLGTDADSSSGDLLDQQEESGEGELTQENEAENTSSSEEQQANNLIQEQLKDQLQTQLKNEAKSEATKQLAQSTNQAGAKQAAKQFMDKGGGQLMKTLGWYLIPILFIWLNIRLLAPKKNSVWREPLKPLGQLGTIVFDLAVIFLVLLQFALAIVVVYGPILLLGGTIGAIFQVISWIFS